MEGLGAVSITGMISFSGIQNIRKPTVVFGHSLGGRVALKLAAERPELVKAIILGDSSLNEPEPSTRMGEFFGRMLPLLEADS